MAAEQLPTVLHGVVAIGVGWSAAVLYCRFLWSEVTALGRGPVRGGRVLLGALARVGAVAACLVAAGGGELVASALALAAFAVARFAITRTVARQPS